MPRKPKAGRPKPIPMGVVRVRVIRGPKGGRWYWRGERHSDRATVWRGWGTPEEVRRAVAQAIADGLPEAEETDELAEIQTVDELLRGWIGHLEDDEPDLARSSLAAYRGTVRRLRPVLGDVLLGQVTEAILVGARNRLRRTKARQKGGRVLERTLSPRTIESDLDRLRAAWDWGRSCGHTPDRGLPAVEVEVPKVVRRTPDQEEIRAVLREVRPGWRYLAVRILFATGARIGECAAPRDALDHPRRTLLLDGKTGPRTVLLPQDLADELAAFRDTHDRPELLGVGLHTVRSGVYWELRRATTAAGVPVFSPHRLRAAFVDHAQASGVDVATTCRYTGHTPAVMFEYYRTATERDMQRALDVAAFGALEAPKDDANVLALDQRRKGAKRTP